MVDLHPLTSRDPQHRQRRVATQHPPHRFGEQLLRDAACVVDLDLLLDRFGREDFLNGFAQPLRPVEITVDHPGEEARRSPKIKTLASCRPVKEVESSIPNRVIGTTQRRTNTIVIDRLPELPAFHVECGALNPLPGIRIAIKYLGPARVGADQHPDGSAPKPKTCICANGAVKGK